MFIVETAIVCGTAILLGTYRFVDRIHKRELQDVADSEAAEREIRKAEQIRKDIENPANVQARRDSIEKRRQLILDELAQYQKAWEKACDNKDASIGNWSGITRCRDRLAKLAIEESEIPLNTDK